MRKSCQKEIDELWSSIGEVSKRNYVAFLDLLKEKYPSYQKAEAHVKKWEKLFTEDAKKSVNLAKTFLKFAIFYHSDKKPQARNPNRWGDDQERQEYLRDEIAKITN